MQPNTLPTPADRTSHRAPTRPVRGGRTTPLRRLGRLVAVVALAAATGGAFAQSDADPAEVVVAELGDTAVTLEAFDLRFEAAVRSMLAQQGVEPDDEVLAGFEAQRPAFLEQVGQELVLSEHAEELGVAAADDEVDAVIEEARAEYGDQLDEFIAELGFASTSEFASGVRRSLNAQRAVEEIRAGAEVDDAAIEAWYEANLDQVEGPDGPQPLEQVREQISALLVNEHVQVEVAELVAESDIELFPDRL
ncbi:MAG: SurA N-terminal domain-containing protein [Trueperaceae bacterium]